MFYPKNVPTIERGLRVFFGLVLIGLALFGQPLVGSTSMLRAIVMIGSALFLMVTGFVGWCPACALIGRKLKSKKPE